jgi:uncharacterized protein (TIGR03118 family)
MVIRNIAPHRVFFKLANIADYHSYQVYPWSSMTWVDEWARQKGRIMKSRLNVVVGTMAALSLGTVSYAQQYNQTNLVSSASGLAPVTDASLVDPWGMNRASNNAWWVSDNDTGVSTLYNGAGAKNPLVVTIPSVDPKNSPKGSPTGVIANASTTDFLITSGKPANFIFATLDGGIVAWNPTVAISPSRSAPSTNAVLVAKTTDGSAYTGLTSNFIKGKRYLYAANFTKERVDVYDSSFHRVMLDESSEGRYSDDDLRDIRHNQPFTDDAIPKDFAPFNVQAIGPNVAVTYGLHIEGQKTAAGGEGLGYVDIYSSSGELLTRLEHGEWFNAPWGVVLAPLDFGRFSHDLLVGQFGGGGSTPSAGVVAAFDIATGKFEGLVQDATGKPVVISGLWSLAPGNLSPDNQDPAAAPAATVYFTARNSGKGLFGHFTAVSQDLIEGSAQ